MPCVSVVRVPGPNLFHFLLRSYNYNKYLEGLLPANLRLVTLPSSDNICDWENSDPNTFKW